MVMMKNGYADIRVDHDNGERIADITEIVKSVTMSGDVTHIYRQLDVTLHNSADGRNRRINFRNGDYIRFTNHGTELFRGRIFNLSVNDVGEETLTVFDQNVYLTKSQTVETFRNMTAASIVRRLARDFGIPVGTIDDTGFVIPKLVAEQDTLSDVIVKALTITEDQNGRRFRLFNREGRIYLEERLGQVSRDVLENGINILSATRTQSIEDLRNRLVMIGGADGQYREIRVNNELVDKYGMLQAVEKLSGNAVSRSEVKQAADRRFAEITKPKDDAQITCLGIDSVTSGTAVYVIERMTGVVGGYYVTADSHTYSEGMHEMSITLSATDDLPRIEISEQGAEE